MHPRVWRGAGQRLEGDGGTLSRELVTGQLCVFQFTRSAESHILLGTEALVS